MLHLRVVVGESSVGQELKTKERNVTFGREHGCSMMFKEESVSRQHGELTQFGGRLVFKDRNSHNGSRILHRNGVHVELGPLHVEEEVFTGDFLLLGAVEIEVVGFEGASQVDMPLSDYTVVGALRELPLALGSVQLVKGDQDVLDNFLTLPSFHPTNEQEALDALAVNMAHTWPNASCVTVLTLADEAIGNEVVSPSDIEFSSSHSSDAADDSGFSLSILNQVLERKAALCFECPNVMPTAESVTANNIRSCLCAPLLDDRGIFGFVQIYTKEGPVRPFGRRDLSVLSVLTGVSSLILRQIRAAKRESHLRTFASVGQVVAGLSHDARNILVSLGAYMNSLEREFEPLKESPKWQHVHEDVDFLRFLVQDTWSRITPHNRPAKNSKVILSELIESTAQRCVRYFIPEQMKQWVVIENHVPAELVVHLDGELLSVALFNCIKNSLDAYRFAADDCRAEAARLEMHGRVARLPTGTYAELAIIDNAGGIPNSIRQKLGQELVSTKGEMGSGLGTRIMIESIQRLGGITKMATSTEAGDVPAGTCVVFHLPLSNDNPLPSAGDQPLQFNSDYEELRRKFQRP